MITYIRISIKVSFLIGLICILLFKSSQSASITPIVGYVGTYSSNVLRTSVDEQWEWVNRPLVGFDVDHRGRSLNAYGYGAAEYFDFTQGSADNETYYDINAVAEWNIISDRFVWVAENYASVTPIVVSAPLTPLNVEQRNIFITGPTLSSRIGTRGLFDWSIRYGNFYYQKSNIDNQRYYSDIGISRQVNPSNSLRLGYEFTRTIFREEFYQDFIRQDVALTYNYVGLGKNLTMSGGYTYIDEEDSKESFDGWLLRILGSQRAGHRTLLNFLASSELTDTGLANLSRGVGQIIPDVLVTPNQAFSAPSQAATTDIFRESILGVGMTNSNPSLVTEVELGYTQANYITDDLRNNQRLSLDISLDHPLRIDAVFGVFFGIGRQDYPNQGVDGFIDDDARIGSDITWRLFRRVNVVFELSRYVRRSNEPDRGYTETRAEVQLIYRPSNRGAVTRGVRGR